MKLETKGKSKITAQQVIAARKLKAANPDMSMQAIKDKLGLEIHTIMVGRAIRGITHSHLDMCGLPIRPFNHTEPITRRIARKEARKTARAEKAAASKSKRAAAPAKKAVTKKAVAKKQPPAQPKPKAAKKRVAAKPEPAQQQPETEATV